MPYTAQILHIVPHDNYIYNVPLRSKTYVHDMGRAGVTQWRNLPSTIPLRYTGGPEKGPQIPMCCINSGQVIRTPGILLFSLKFR